MIPKQKEQSDKIKSLKSIFLLLIITTLLENLLLKILKLINWIKITTDLVHRINRLIELEKTRCAQQNSLKSATRSGS